VHDVGVRYRVERRELGGSADGTVKEDLPVEDGLRGGGGGNLFSPQVDGVEVALVSGEIVVDGEATLAKEHVR